MQSLGLPRAKILYAAGFGQRTQTSGSFDLGYAEEDGGCIEVRTARGGKMAYRFGLEHLTLRAGDAGGRSSRPAVEMGDGALGLLDAGWLAARNRRYGMLTLRHEHPDRAARVVMLGFRHLADEDIAARVHDALAAIAARGLLTAEQAQRLDPPAPGAGLAASVSDLQQLVDLHRAGLLTAKEFAAAKAKLLGS